MCSYNPWTSRELLYRLLLSVSRWGYPRTRQCLCPLLPLRFERRPRPKSEFVALTNPEIHRLVKVWWLSSIIISFFSPGTVTWITHQTVLVRLVVMPKVGSFKFDHLGAPLFAHLSASLSASRCTSSRRHCATNTNVNLNLQRPVNGFTVRGPASRPDGPGAAAYISCTPVTSHSLFGLGRVSSWEGRARPG